MVFGPTQQQPPQVQPPGAQHYVLGFNLIVSRIATMRLLEAVGLALVNRAQSITICLSSIGGDPEQAFYAYEMLLALPVPLTTFNVGSVQSAAMMIFLAGAQRFAVPDSHFLMHRTVHLPAPGSSYGQDMLDHSAASILADDRRSMAVIAQRTGQPLKAVRRWHSGQRLRSAQFAQNNGIVHAIRPFQFPTPSQFLQVTAVS